jgi:hypothetical protein
MANQSSQVIQDIAAGKALRNTVYGAPLRVASATLAWTSAAANDVKSMFRLPSRAVVKSLKLYGDSLDSNASPTLSVHVGLYDTSGNVVNASFFKANANDLRAASDGTEIAFGNVIGKHTKAKKLWEHLGLAKDPNVEYVVAFTVATAAATFAAGSTSLECLYVAEEV